MTFHRTTALRRRPTVSVVVPCYRYGRYLPQLVATLVDQPDVEVDVLIVDDASPDESGEIADDLAARHPRVRVLHHEQNLGHIRTYNDGLAAIDGEYVILLSADDLLPPGAIGRAVALMERFPNVGFVYGYAKSFTGRPPVTSPTVRNWSVWSGEEWLALSTRRARCFISSPEVVMRTAALRQVGDYDPALPHSGDLDLWLRTALGWDVGRVNGPVQALYRVHEQNMHLTTYAGMITDLRERRRTFGMLFDHHGAARADVQQLRPLNSRALAKESLRLALTAHREGGDPALVTDYLDFALETDPRIRRTALWQLCRRGPIARATLPAERLGEFSERLRHHLVWRRERRYGT